MLRLLPILQYSSPTDAPVASHISQTNAQVYPHTHIRARVFYQLAKALQETVKWFGAWHDISTKSIDSTLDIYCSRYFKTITHAWRQT